MFPKDENHNNLTESNNDSHSIAALAWARKRALIPDPVIGLL